MFINRTSSELRNEDGSSSEDLQKMIKKDASLISSFRLDATALDENDSIYEIGEEHYSDLSAGWRQLYEKTRDANSAVL